MVSIVCLVTGSLLFLLFRPYKDCSWLNIWDSAVFSLGAFMLFSILYSKYASEVIGTLLSAYMVIYVIYRLVVWMKTLHIFKKKYKDQLIHHNDYENDKEVKLLVSDDRENDYPQDSKLETYPVCGNSQQKYGSV